MQQSPLTTSEEVLVWLEVVHPLSNLSLFLFVC